MGRSARLRPRRRRLPTAAHRPGRRLPPPFRTPIGGTMPGGKLPGGVKITAGAYGQWAGPDIGNKTNELDVWGVGSDGCIYHWWFRVDTNKWYGPEAFG